MLLGFDPAIPCGENPGEPFDPEKKKKENNNPPLEEKSETKEEDKQKEKDMNVVDRFSKYTSHVIIGLVYMSC